MTGDGRWIVSDDHGGGFSDGGVRTNRWTEWVRLGVRDDAVVVLDEWLLELMGLRYGSTAPTPTPSWTASCTARCGSTWARRTCKRGWPRGDEATQPAPARDIGGSAPQ